MISRIEADGVDLALALVTDHCGFAMGFVCVFVGVSDMTMLMNFGEDGILGRYDHDEVQRNRGIRIDV